MAKVSGNKEVKAQMQNLGFYLPNIRDGFKWSLEDVAERLGVSKQTVLNIEKQARKNIEENIEYKEIQTEKDCMTYAQYVTLRIIIEDEIVSLAKKDEKGKEMAKRIKFIMCVLVDDDMEKLSKDDKERISKQNKLAFMTTIANVTTISSLFGVLNLVGVFSPLVNIGAVTTGEGISWLKPWNENKIEKIIN